MYTIYGFNQSFNTTKVLFAAEELGISYRYVALNPAMGEHKAAEHMARHPLGKTPVLEHDGQALFESSTICRYLASDRSSALYPLSPHYSRALVDQWMDYFSSHAGRWLGVLLFERIFREQLGMGQTNHDNEREALNFLGPQLQVIDDQLGRHAYLAGDSLSVADPFAFAYVDTASISQFSLQPYPNLVRWYNDYQSRSSVARVYAQIGTQTLLNKQANK